MLLQGLIGHGGYGEIYYAIDVRSQEEVAVKVEPKKRKGRTVKRMILEQKVLLRLQGRPHVPKMIASGHDSKINFIVMQLLSVNVGDLKKASPVRRLGRSTVGRILQQAIAGLRDIHVGGYIHRDVKPANMCFGISPQFRGTVRYVSIRVHDRIDQGPADDLQSGDPQTSFLALTNESFQEFARAVFSLNTEEEPNYAALQALLTSLPLRIPTALPG
ncbi:hypothetical protein OESDEN_05108 [Oesophagostomum dentatum]|uniref:non-specific serine/threonine protein kinase n=1 Tax=Oesophagostomum dentatum TaxID=61180 RepID=A0A0B1THR7_OESDE|nr:hypothetical protein OESDEN_05108 [Oesophagostomum dentatum]